MKDILQDIVSHTQSVGINIVKINGDANGVTIESKSEDNSLILKGAFDKPTYKVHILKDLTIDSPLINNYISLLNIDVLQFFFFVKNLGFKNEC